MRCGLFIMTSEKACWHSRQQQLYAHPLAEDIARAEAEAAVNPDPAKLEAAYYRAAAEALFGDARYERTHHYLKKSLDKLYNLVFLTDARWSPPFSPNAAPIHKLLVAHAKACRENYLYFRGRFRTAFPFDGQREAV